MCVSDICFRGTELKLEIEARKMSPAITENKLRRILCKKKKYLRIRVVIVFNLFIFDKYFKIMCIIRW